MRSTSGINQYNAGRSALFLDITIERYGSCASHFHLHNFDGTRSLSQAVPLRAVSMLVAVQTARRNALKTGNWCAKRSLALLAG
jgi:hypothetical protein